MKTTTTTFATILEDQLTANGYTMAEFAAGYKKNNSPSWKRGYAAAHGVNYGSYIESQIVK